MLDADVIAMAANLWYEDDKARRLAGAPFIFLRNLMKEAGVHQPSDEPLFHDRSKHRATAS